MSSHRSSTAGQQSAQIRTTHIRVNQLGYDPTAAKLAVAFADGLLPDRFTVVDIQTQRAVFTGVAKPLPGRWGVFDHHAELDFSQLKTPGQYLISFNDSRSPQFEIRPAVYRNLPDQSLEFMRQQRCGTTRGSMLFVTPSTDGQLMAHCRPAPTLTQPAVGTMPAI
jgi:cellulase-like Ig domain-containing protein